MSVDKVQRRTRRIAQQVSGKRRQPRSGRWQTGCLTKRLDSFTDARVGLVVYGSICHVRTNRPKRKMKAALSR